jgi:hypothetical protein
LWTIQTEAAFEILSARGRLTTPRSLADSDFSGAYDWMVGQMLDRVGAPRERDSSPVWAWCQYESRDRRRPDLRHTGHLPRGQPGYRLEVDVNASKCLLSDFDLWHYVLNYWYLPTSERDCNRFEELNGGKCYSWDDRPPGPLNLSIRESWVRVFDLDWYEEYVTHPVNEKQIQAVLWEIRLTDVCAVDRFTAR